MKNTITLFLALFVIVNVSYSQVNDSSNTDFDLQDGKEYPKNLLQTSDYKKYYVSAGVGVMELYNIGFSYLFDHIQIGVYIGSGNKGSGIYSGAVDLRYHFGKDSKLSNRSSWYIKGGLVHYLRINDTESYIYLNNRIGRDFNLSKRLGIYFEIGGNILLAYYNYDNPESEYPYEFSLLPSLGIGFFIRI